MAHDMRGSFLIMIFMDMENIHGQMGGYTKVNG
jgi:hypothetical protein